jgi:hypothetical protein
MSTSLHDLRTSFVDEISLYQTPITYTNTLYDKIVKSACKQYYIDTGKEDSWTSDYSDTGATPILNIDLSLTQEQYVLTWAQIIFIKQIRSDVAKLTSYSTDALSVTSSDKPYQSLKNDLNELHTRLTELFYNLGEETTSMTPVTAIEIVSLDVTYS